MKFHRKTTTGDLIRLYASVDSNVFLLADDPAPEPTVVLGSGTEQAPKSGKAGSLDPAIARRYLQRELPLIKACYEKQLRDEPELSGTMTAAFTVTARGHIVGGHLAGLSAPLRACTWRAIRPIRLPRPRSGGATVMTFTIVFRAD